MKFCLLMQNISHNFVSAIISFTFLFTSFLQSAENTSLKNERKTVAPPGISLVITAGVSAALFPCACPVDPAGGIARRKKAMDDYRAAHPDRKIIAIEFGDFLAGGPLDTSSVSPEIDAERTSVYLEALKAMDYNFLLPGETETLWKKKELVDLLSENADLSLWLKSRYLSKPGVLTAFLFDKETGRLEHTAPVGGTAGKILEVEYLAGIEAFKQRLAKIGNTEDADLGKFLSLQPLVFFLDAPSAEIAKAVKLVPSRPVVVVTPQGAAVSAEVLRASGVRIIQIGKEARELLVLEFSGRRPFPVMKKISLGSGAEENQSLALAAEKFKDSIRESFKRGVVVPVEYFGAIDCSVCTRTWPEMVRFRDRFKNMVKINVHLLVHKLKDGSFRAGLGYASGDEQALLLAETRRVLLIRKYAPDKVFDYLTERMKSPADPGWEKFAKKAGIPVWRIRAALRAGESEPLLEEEAALCKSRGITATPTIFIFNRPFPKNLYAPYLATAVCNTLQASGLEPPECVGVAACNDDSDCSKPGYWGFCSEPGTPEARCEYEKAAEVGLDVLYDSRAVFSNHDSQVEAFMTILPGLKVKFFDVATDPVAAEKAGKINPMLLPCYVFDKRLKKARNAGEISELVDWKDGVGAVVKSSRDLTAANLFYRRKRLPGRLDVFVSPHSAKADKMLIAVIAGLRKFPLELRPEVRYHWICFKSADGKLTARYGLGELEEEARRVAVEKMAPDKIEAYLRADSAVIGTSYWDRPLEAVGLKPEAVRKRAVEQDVFERMFADAESTRTFAPGADFFLLVRNREVLDTVNEILVEHILEVLASDKAPE